MIRLASGSVLYACPVTWPGNTGRPGKHGISITCHNDPGQANPEPDESPAMPDTPLYTAPCTPMSGTRCILSSSHHGDRGWFASWDGDLPVLRGTVLRVTEHAFKFAKDTLGLTAAKVLTPEQADRWVRLVMAAFAQLLVARPLAPDPRQPWETRPPGNRPLSPGRVRRGFANIRARVGPRPCR